MTEETNNQDQISTEASHVDAKIIIDAAENSTDSKSRNSGSAFYKNKIEELERNNAIMLKKLEEQKTIQLKEKENYKELWEIEKNKRIAAEDRTVKLSKDYLSGLKMSAIEQEALKAGILPEALSDIRVEDATMVEIETGDKGSVSILGAKEYVEFLKETKKHWFNAFRVPKINTQVGESSASRELSAKEIIMLQKKDPVQYATEMKKRLKLV